MSRLVLLLFWVLHAATCLEARDSDSRLPFPLAPPQHFAPTYNLVKNVECRNHGLKFLKDLKEMKIWALKMYDSSGKVSSGVLRGNVKWLGDDKECFSVASNPGGEDGHEDNIRGQYCTATIYVEPTFPIDAKQSTSQREIHEILSMIHSNNAFRSNHTQNNQLFPSFSTMDIGLCIPHTCRPSDLRVALSEWLFPGNTSQVFELDTHIVVGDDACMTEQLKMSMKGKLFLCFCALFTAVGIAGYFYDVNYKKRIKEGEVIKERGIMLRIFLAFSFRRTLRLLLDTETPTDELRCIHGMRTIFSLLLYFIHKFLVTLFIPLANRDDLTMYISGYFSMIIRSFWGHVDTFVLLSGFLTAYYSFKRLEEHKKLSITQMYLRRYLKFTPIFAIIVLWSESIAELMVTESQYIFLVKHFIDNCRNKWFNILTYTNTLQGMNKMCIPNAHQLETDMHMYLLSPFIVIFLWKMPKIAMISMLGTLVSLSYLKYRIVMTGEAATVLYHGIDTSTISKSADKIYLNFLHRLVPYFYGILLAYYLRIRDKKRKLSKVSLLIGSAFALWGAYYSFLSMEHLSRPGCTHDVSEAAIYGVLQPFTWGFALSWLLYLCITGQAESINRLLSWKGFLIPSRLSYAFYLCQMGIILTEVSAKSTPLTLTPGTLFDMNTIVKVVLASVWLTLLFFIPFSELWDIMNKASKPSTKNKED